MLTFNQICMHVYLQSTSDSGGNRLHDGIQKTDFGGCYLRPGSSKQSLLVVPHSFWVGCLWRCPQTALIGSKQKLLFPMLMSHVSTIQIRNTLLAPWTHQWKGEVRGKRVMFEGRLMDSQKWEGFMLWGAWMCSLDARRKVMRMSKDLAWSSEQSIFHSRFQGAVVKIYPRDKIAGQTDSVSRISLRLRRELEALSHLSAFTHLTCSSATLSSAQSDSLCNDLCNDPMCSFMQRHATSTLMVLPLRPLL